MCVCEYQEWQRSPTGVNVGFRACKLCKIANMHVKKVVYADVASMFFFLCLQEQKYAGGRIHSRDKGDP